MAVFWHVLQVSGLIAHTIWIIAHVTGDGKQYLLEFENVLYSLICRLFSVS